MTAMLRVVLGAVVLLFAQAVLAADDPLRSWSHGAAKERIVNYTPDRAVTFDLEGNAVEVLDRAYRIGDVSLSIGKRPISSRDLEAIFG